MAGSGDNTNRPLPWVVKLGKSDNPGGVKSCRTPFFTAPLHKFGALATRTSAVRAPVPCSAAYLEKTTVSSTSLGVTVIHGYCLLKAVITGFHSWAGGLP